MFRMASTDLIALGEASAWTFGVPSAGFLLCFDR